MKRSFIAISLAAILITACGGGVTQAGQEPRGIDGIEISDVVFAKNLTDDMEPETETKSFDPSEKVNVSVRIIGRPKEGDISAKFMYRDMLIAETSLDLSEINKGLGILQGQDTFAGFSLTHDEPLYISPNYRVELSINDQPAGEFAFSIVPPSDAVTTVIRRTEFARGATALMDPIEPTTVFAPSDNVFFIGNGDFGKFSWLQAEWITNGIQLEQTCTKSFVLKNNLEQDRFYFSCSLDEGWPIGTHAVRLTVDDVIVTEATFTVQ